MNDNARFFGETLQDRDPVIGSEIALDLRRQQTQIGLVASENIVSAAVLEAQGTVLANTYAEGYPSQRDDDGEHVGRIEALAIDRVKALFDARFANVQPHSGAQANGAAMLALVRPGEAVMTMALDAGGDRAHGSRFARSGGWFDAVPYGVDPYTGRIDFDRMRRLAETHRPKLVIAGHPAYPRALDFAKLREIADSVGALLMVDLAHIAGIVVARRHGDPLRYADVVTSTTHETLRGPRGGFILTNRADLASKIDAAVFPGLGGGPMMHAIAGKAVAFGEALRPEFGQYIDRVLTNAVAFGDMLTAGGLLLVTGGTDTHLLLVDLRPRGLTGVQAEKALERVGITCNRTGIPFDPRHPMVASGILLGTPAGTSRGFGEREFRLVGEMILELLAALERSPEGNAEVERAIRGRVRDLCSRFPIYRMAADALVKA